MSEEANQTTQVQTTAPAKGSLVVSVNAPTPMWATWAFRIIFLLTTAMTMWIAGTHLVAEGSKVEVMLALKALDVVVWGAGRLLGIQKPEIDTE